MAIKSRALLKSTFQNGYIPTQNDFADVFDSYIHKTEDYITINGNGNVGIGLGTGVVPTRKLHVGGDVQVDGMVYANDLVIPGKGLIPTGGIIMWSGATAPAGWGLCNGVTYTRSDGSGLIASPDLRGRFIVGMSDSNPGNFVYNNNEKNRPDYNTIGKNGGLMEVKLTDLESGIAPHNHHINIKSSSNGAHSTTYQTTSQGWGYGGGFVSRDGGTNANFDIFQTAVDHDHDVIGYSDLVNANDAAQAHENRPPYYVLAYIMKL